MKSLRLFTLALLPSLALAQNARFERTTAALNEVHDHCAPVEACLLVTLSYVATFGSRVENDQHIGKLDPWTEISMIRPANSPWLALRSRVPNLPPQPMALFPNLTAARNAGLHAPALWGPHGNVTQSPLNLPVSASLQKSIYKVSPTLEIGYVQIPRAEAEHVILPRSGRMFEDNYTIGYLLPLRLHSHIFLGVKSRTANDIQTSRLVGVPNQNGSTEDEHNAAWMRVQQRLPKETTLYSLQFVDKSGLGPSIITTETTLD